MYNYFAYEKKKEIKEKKESLQKKKSREKERRIKTDYPLLVNNYEKRIKDFILDMATSKNPIIIKDYLSPIESTRKELMQEEVSKIKGSAGFIFKGFLTDKESIHKEIENNNSNFIEKYMNMNKTERGTSDKKFNQPTMRFKPRTDLERIYDTMNSVSYGSVNKDTVNKQLKNLYLIERGKEHRMISSHEEDEISEKLIYQKKTDNLENFNINNSNVKFIQNPENVNINKKEFVNKPSKRKFVDNSEARLLRKELYFKTHFKATTDMSILKRNKINKISYSKSSPKDSIYRAVKSDIEFDNVSDYNDIDVEILNNTVSINNKKSNKIKVDKEEDFPLITKNPLIKYNYVKEEEHIDVDVLKKLKKMSENLPNIKSKMPTNSRKTVKFLKFSNKENKLDKLFSTSFFRNSILENDNIDDGFKKKDEERIIIDNKTLLKSEIDLISKAVLKRCNYFHSKHKNSEKQLKKGEGKLMITNGMSVSAFLKKMNLTKS